MPATEPACENMPSPTRACVMRGGGVRARFCGRRFFGRGVEPGVVLGESASRGTSVGVGDCVVEAMAGDCGDCGALEDMARAAWEMAKEVSDDISVIGNSTGLTGTDGCPPTDMGVEALREQAGCQHERTIHRCNSRNENKHVSNNQELGPSSNQASISRNLRSDEIGGSGI